MAGWHTSAVRQARRPRLRGRVPYVYTAVYEGGERTPGVFLTGETPGRQLLPAMRCMAREIGVRTWCVVGSDYVWPRVSAREVRGFAPSRSAPRSATRSSSASAPRSSARCCGGSSAPGRRAC